MELMKDQNYSKTKVSLSAYKWFLVSDGGNFKDMNADIIM